MFTTVLLDDAVLCLIDCQGRNPIGDSVCWSVEKFSFCISDYNADATEELEENFLESFLITERGHHLIYK